MTNIQKLAIVAALVASGTAGTAAFLWQGPPTEPGAPALPDYTLALRQLEDGGCTLTELYRGQPVVTDTADCAGAPQVWDLSAGPWACACRAGTDCEVRSPAGAWEPAPRGVYLPAGSWRGAACKPTPCVEVAGAPALNPACTP